MYSTCMQVLKRAFMTYFWNKDAIRIKILLYLFRYLIGHGLNVYFCSLLSSFVNGGTISTEITIAETLYVRQVMVLILGIFYIKKLIQKLELLNYAFSHSVTKEKLQKWSKLRKRIYIIFIFLSILSTFQIFKKTASIKQVSAHKPLAQPRGLPRQHQDRCPEGRQPLVLALVHEHLLHGKLELWHWPHTMHWQTPRPTEVNSQTTGLKWYFLYLCNFAMFSSYRYFLLGSIQAL